MEIRQVLCLPRDASTVPLVRHLCKFALWQIGVTGRCSGDIELAITEACANVINHTAGDDEYEVRVSISDEVCEIRVVDVGHGFDEASLSAGPSDAEHGRGLLLMRSLVDSIQFESKPEQGTIVHLVKQLVFSGPPPPPFQYRRTELDFDA